MNRYNLIAACMMHVEGYFSIKSLAFINKNPGNIEASNGQLNKYSTIQVGYDELVHDISVNRGKPLAMFIAKYAPPTENNTSLYANLVSELSGIALTEQI